MKKVMLIFEDFQESGHTQAILKKVGFDVLAQNNTSRLSDQILTFRPDAIVSSGGQKFPSLVIGQELKKVTHFKGKSILILPAGERPQPAEISKARVDVLVEAPVKPHRLIEILAKNLSLDPAPLLEKFSKAQIQDHAAPPAPRSAPEALAGSDMVMVKGTARTAEHVQLNDRDRVESYQRFVQGMTIDVQQTSHSKTAVRERQYELKKGWDFKILEKLDDLKRAFAEALFKKNN